MVFNYLKLFKLGAHTGENFLIQMTDKLRRCSVSPASINKKEPVGVVKVEHNLSCNDSSIVEFKILSQVSKINLKITILAFKKADLASFRDLLGRTCGILP